MTYQDVGSRIERLTYGLHALGLRPGDKVMIYADTCAEWLMTSLACFKSSLPIVTIYTNLGQSGVSFSVNQVVNLYLDFYIETRQTDRRQTLQSINVLQCMRYKTLRME